MRKHYRGAADASFLSREGVDALTLKEVGIALDTKGTASDATRENYTSVRKVCSIPSSKWLFDVNNTVLSPKGRPGCRRIDLQVVL